MFYYSLCPSEVCSVATARKRRCSSSIFCDDIPFFERFGLLLALYQYNRSVW